MRLRSHWRMIRFLALLGAGVLCACTTEPFRPDPSSDSQHVTFSDAENRLGNCQCTYAEKVDGAWVESPVITVADEDMFVWRDLKGRAGVQSFSELGANWCSASEASLCFDRKIKHYFVFKST